MWSLVCFCVALVDSWIYASSEKRVQGVLQGVTSFAFGTAWGPIHLDHRSISMGPVLEDLNQEGQ